MVLNDIFKFYEDELLQKEITDTISFGELMAGETKSLTLYIKNVSNAIARDLVFEAVPVIVKQNQMIEVIATGEKVKILKSPERLDPTEVAIVELEWTARIDLRQALEAKLTITGNAVYKSRL